MQNLFEAANANTKQSTVESQKEIDLSSPGVLVRYSKKIVADIDGYCVKAYSDGHRKHLGASLIGNECWRYLWYVFRWCFTEQFEGRKYRLFNRGHREEERFVEWLRGIGCEVWTHEKPAEYKPDGTVIPPQQFRINGVHGHFGGSLDSVVKLPASYKVPEPILGEYKTNGTGPNFNNLVAHGVTLEKPVHFAQMSTYGFKYRFRYALYLNINKNDDDIHAELITLNWKLGEQMEQKAERIISSQVPPPRLSNNSSFIKCVSCAAYPVCHESKPVEMNCRSCVYAVPMSQAQWHCGFHGQNIPKDFIPKGCQQYKAIVN